MSRTDIENFALENAALGGREGNYVTFRGGNGSAPSKRLIRNPGDPGFVETFDRVPVVDFANINHPDLAVRKQLANELAEAAHEVGFWYAKNAPVSRELMEQTFATLEKFFALPLSEKNTANWKKTPGARGYEPSEDVHLEMNFKGPGELRESFFFGDDYTDPVQWDGPIPEGYGPQNIWPSGHPWFKQAMDTYYQVIYPFARSVLRLFALALDLPENAFEQDFKFPITMLRGIHYPPQDPTAAPAGIVAHADYASLTFVLQGEKYGSGLEVLDLNGHWHPAPYRDDAPIICNIGDYLQHLSNGRFVSTVHRVVNTSGKTRLSLPFFMSPDPTVTIKPVLRENEERKTEVTEYEVQTVGDFFVKRLLKARKTLPAYAKVMELNLPEDQWKYTFVTGGLPQKSEIVA